MKRPQFRSRRRNDFCSNAARHPAVSKSDLLEGVEVVSSGVGELTRLQDAGYAYIRL